MAKRKKRVRKARDENQSVPDDEGLLWVQEVEVRPRSERRPMARLSRWKKRLGIWKRDEPPKEDQQAETPDETDGSPTPRAGVAFSLPDDESDDEDDYRQFTVTKLSANTTCWQRLCARLIWDDDTDEFSYRPGKLFVAYINWTFQWSFLCVFLSFLAIFMLLTFTFGGLLKLAGDAYPGCIVVSGEEFGYDPSTKIADAFALSWTTFTTVGYGMTYTSTGTDYHDQNHCSLIVFLCTSESFIGLLYAGMCAAILFGKIGRIQSHAQIKFSNALCIQLAKDPDDVSNREPETPLSTTGETAQAETPQAETPLSRMDTPQSTRDHGVPCPVLTFQVVNKLSNTPGGEIMDANMRAVANQQASGAAASAVSSFVKVQLAEFEHPFFNRVWQGRHTLGANSQLLTPFARSMIRQNGGLWPVEWNNPDDVRKHLRLSNLIVILTGISNISAATVHGYKKYQHGDLLVGYKFAPVLYKDSDTNRLQVDMSLINDVIEQSHCQAEIIGDSENETEVDDKQQPGLVYSKSIRLDVQRKSYGD